MTTASSAYILAPQRLAAGDKVVAGESVDVKPGNAMPLGSMPVGTIVHNVEMKPGKRRPDRALGRHLCAVVGRDQGMRCSRLNSGEQRLVHERLLRDRRRGVQSRPRQHQ